MITQRKIIQLGEEVKKVQKATYYNDGIYLLHIAFHTDKGNIYTIKLDNWAQSRFQAQIERFELFEGNPLKYEIILQLDFNKDIIDFRVRDKYEKI